MSQSYDERLTELCESYAGETGDACREIINLERELDQSWVPIVLDAELMRPGDVVVAEGPALLMVESVDDPRDAHDQPVGQLVRIHVTGDKSWRVVRDYPVSVLVPYTEREALILARSHIGARITDRKTTGSGS